jgi:hypothetical protein
MQNIIIECNAISGWDGSNGWHVGQCNKEQIWLVLKILDYYCRGQYR